MPGPVGPILSTVGTVAAVGNAASGPTSETSTTQSLSPEQRRLISLAIPTFERYIQQTPDVPAREIQPFNEFQEAAQGSALAAIPGLQGYLGTLQEGLNTVGNFGSTLAAQGSDPNAFGFLNNAPQFDFSSQSSPYIEAASNAIIDPIRTQLIEQTLPHLRGSAIGAGQYGGSRQGLAEDSALTRATQDAAIATAPLAQQFYGQAFQGDINRHLQSNQLQAQRQNVLTQAAASLANTTPQLSAMQAQLALQSGLLPSHIYSTIGDTRQQHAQLTSDQAYQQRLTELALPFIIASQVAGLGGSLPGGTVTSQSKQPSFFERLF